MELESAFVLHSRPFRNTSLLVDLFSETHGRVSVVARSARGLKSRYQGQLQLFTPMLVNWTGRYELKSLNKAELNGMPYQLNDNALFCGFYVNELLMRLLQKEDAYPKLFLFYQNVLRQLEDGVAVPAALRMFEKKLLEVLGYGLPLKKEFKSGNVIVSDGYYRFYPQQGFMRVEKCDAAYLGEDLLAIEREEFIDDRVLISAKKIMRVALTQLLGDKPLNSRAFF